MNIDGKDVSVQDGDQFIIEEIIKFNGEDTKAGFHKNILKKFTKIKI